MIKYMTRKLKKLREGNEFLADNALMTDKDEVLVATIIADSMGYLAWLSNDDSERIG